MSKRNRATAGLVGVIIALALAATPAGAQIKICEDVYALASTTWVADTRVEVGKVEGLINGVLYLRFDPAAPVDPAVDEANMVISTKEGDLLLWVDGKASESADGSLVLDLWTLAAKGTGAYAAAEIDLVQSGIRVPEKGGSYKLYGTICLPSTKPRR